MNWVVFDCILCIFYNSIQHNRDVSPKSHIYHLYCYCFTVQSVLLNSQQNMYIKVYTALRTLLVREIGDCGIAVGWGTALRAGRSQVRFPMVSLEFFIDITLLAALWSQGWLSLQQKWVPGIFPWGVKAAGAYGWQPYHLPMPTVLKSESLNLLEP